MRIPNPHCHSAIPTSTHRDVVSRDVSVLESIWNSFSVDLMISFDFQYRYEIRATTDEKQDVRSRDASSKYKLVNEVRAALGG